MKEDLISVGVVALPIVIGILGTLARAWLVNHGYKTDIYDAVSKAAGVAYAYLAHNNLKITDAAALAQALDIGLQTIFDNPEFKAKLDSLGLTKDQLLGLVRAEFGKLLAKDPNVTVAPDLAPKNVAIAVAEPDPAGSGQGALDLAKS